MSIMSRRPTPATYLVHITASLPGSRRVASVTLNAPDTDSLHRASAAWIAGVASRLGVSAFALDINETVSRV